MYSHSLKKLRLETTRKYTKQTDIKDYYHLKQYTYKDNHCTVSEMFEKMSDPMTEYLSWSHFATPRAEVVNTLTGLGVPDEDQGLYTSCSDLNKDNIIFNIETGYIKATLSRTPNSQGLYEVYEYKDWEHDYYFYPEQFIPPHACYA